MMQQWFSTHTSGSFLASGWKTQNTPGFLSAILFSVVLSIIYECSNYTGHVCNLRSSLWQGTRKERVLAHGALSAIRTLSVFMAYIMMLCVMTYNIWILISVIIGAGVGHFVCRPLLTIAVKKKMRNAQDLGENIVNDTTVTNDSIFLTDISGTLKEEDQILQETNFS